MLLELVLDKEIKSGFEKAGLIINEEVLERKYAKNAWQRKRKFKHRLRERAIVKPRESEAIAVEESALCVDLWHSVVIQALYDISGRGGNFERRIMRAEALAWFAATTNVRESNFEYVCGLANLHPGRVRQVAKLVRENGKEIMEGFNFRTFRKPSSARVGRKVKKKDNKQ